VLAGLLLLALSTRARAADLQLHAPEDCATAAAIRAQVEALIDRPLAQVEHVSFAVEIAQRSAGDFMLSLRTARDDGSAPRVRQLLGASCDEVADAAAVAIALAITGASPAPDDAAPPATAAADVHRVEAPPQAKSVAPASEAPPAVPERTPWRAAAGVYALIDASVLPAIAPGAQLELVGGFRGISLRVAGAVFASQRALLPDDSGGADFGLVLAAALLCAERSFGGSGHAPALRGGASFAPWQALACAGAELGSLSGQGADLTVPLDRATLFSAARAEAGLGYALQPGLTILLRAGVAAPFTRRDFQLNHGQHLHRPAPLSPRLTLGLQLQL
jgi:hypothetical protein